MDTKEQELKALLADIAVRERHAYKRSMIAVLIPIVVGALWISYSFYQVKKRDLYIKELDQKIIKLDGIIEDKEKQSNELDGRVKNNREALQKMTAILAPLAQADPDLSRQVAGIIESNPDAANYVPLILIHPRNEQQRALAIQLERDLQRRGYIVQINERQVRRGPSDTQVRFFRDQEYSEAELIANLLKRMGVRDAHPWRITEDYSPSHKIPRQFEIWFGPN